MPKKKEKVLTLRLDQDSFKTVEDYAKGMGLSVSAYITSVLDSYSEWFIPLASNERIAIPECYITSFTKPMILKIYLVMNY